MDKKPFRAIRGYRWFEHPDRDEESDLKPDLFALLGGGISGKPRPDEWGWRDYPTEEEAMAALRAAERAQ